VSGAASAGTRDIPPGVRRRARRLAWVYLIVAVGLIVWTVFLALSLPKENLEHHYRLTWTGPGRRRVTLWVIGQDRDLAGHWLRSDGVLASDGKQYRCSRPGGGRNYRLAVS
jgi:hypothetical protein